MVRALLADTKTQARRLVKPRNGRCPYGRPATSSGSARLGDSPATKRLYAQLEQQDPIGTIAINLMRAQKASERAKVERGGAPGRGSYRLMAYKKTVVDGQPLQGAHRAQRCLRPHWGCGEDPKQEYHRQVLYGCFRKMRERPSRDGKQASGRVDCGSDFEIAKVVAIAALEAIIKYAEESECRHREQPAVARAAPAAGLAGVLPPERSRCPEEAVAVTSVSGAPAI
jgi:hypothetical protein